MSVQVHDDVDPGFVDELRRAMVGAGDGDTEVVDVHVTPTEDVGGDAAWGVTLVLAPPRRDRYDVDEVLALTAGARRATDDIAARRGLGLVGFTSVVLTTVSAEEPDDESVTDEQPRRKADHGRG